MHTTLDGPRSTTNTDERVPPTDPLITQDSYNSSIVRVSGQFLPNKGSR